MRRALADLPPIVVPMWLVTHRDVRTSRRVRLVAEFLAEELGREPDERAASTPPRGEPRGSGEPGSRKKRR